MGELISIESYLEDIKMDIHRWSTSDEIRFIDIALSKRTRPDKLRFIQNYARSIDIRSLWGGLNRLIICRYITSLVDSIQ